MTHHRPAARTSRHSEGAPLGTTQGVRIKLLGGFDISVGSRSIEDDEWHLRKAKSLVKLLALAPGHRLHREQVMERLWPNSGPDAAANSLYQTVHNVRGVIDPDSPGPFSPYLRLQDEELALCPEVPLWTDVEAFESAAAAARRTRDPASYRVALELYTGELLPEDRYEEWAEGRRQGLHALYQELLIELARLHEERGEFKAAIDALRRVLTSEVANEQTHRDLMRLYAAAGQRDRALRQYEQLREVLRRELGLEPDVASEHLYREISSGRFPPTQPTPGDVRKTANVRRHNLPLQLTTFVGRQREMAEIRQLLAASRLVTLTGAGGSGKTRLAVAVANELLPEYADGVWLVELAPLTDPTLVPKAVAAALGVREEPGRELLITLVDYLRHRELLLLLDNCEHLVGACASLVQSLLRECPHLRILATSREALRIGGEATWLVPSLSVPGKDVLPPVEDLVEYEAVRLFVDRVRSHRPRFELTEENARSVAEICQRLDGIPLAIELAAARARAMTVEQIATRLDNSLRLLTGGDRTATPRQQTLKGALEWSYDLLSRSERELFFRLSVFVGGFTLEAAEALMSVKQEEMAAEDVSQLLLQLVDKSLVVAEESGGGSLRYRILEPVRQYGRERLEESGKAERIRQRHAEHYLSLAEEADPELRGARQVSWLERLEKEQDNLRATMAWLLRNGELEKAARLGWALWFFWWIHGHFSEGRRWMEEALAKGVAMPASSRAKALFVAGTMASGQADRRSAELLLEESLALFRELRDKRGAAHALGSAGLVALDQKHHERGIIYFQEAADLFLEVGDKWGTGIMLCFLAVGWLDQGDHTRAKRLAERGLALSREVGDRQGTSAILYVLARLAQAERNHEQARRLFEEGLKLSAEVGDETNVAYCLEGLAAIAASEDRLVSAAQLWGTAEALLEKIEVTAYPYAPDRFLYQSQVTAARARLDQEMWAEAWAEGRAMTPEQAVEYATSGEEPTTLTTPVPEKLPPTNLTRREREVAILVARELTNRQIASELVLSERTVETHVRNILGKLGLRSRAQLAPWLTEQELLGQDSN